MYSDIFVVSKSLYDKRHRNRTHWTSIVCLNRLQYNKVETLDLNKVDQFFVPKQASLQIFKTRVPYPRN